VAFATVGIISRKNCGGLCGDVEELGDKVSLTEGIAFD
jgi:hypothetical protein